MAYIFLLYALFASVFTISKTALEYSQPFFLIGSRMMIAGAILLAYQFIFNRQPLNLKWQTWLKLLQLALFNIYMTNVLEFWGLKYLTSFKTCFIYSLSPFLSAVMSYFMFAEKISFTKFVGLVIGFLGFIPILLTQSTTEELTGQFFIFSWAEISVVLAATLSVYGWILLKQLVGEAQLSPVFANGASMFIGGSIALIHSALTENWNPLPTSDLGIFIKTTLLLIVVSNLICYNLYGFLLKRYSAVFISFAGFTTPAFTAFFGWLFLNEVVTWPFYLSFFIVIIGMMIFEYDKLKYAELKSVKI